MQVDYKNFIDRMINKYEGGYGWNKKDPGGPTKYGVTCFDLAEHRHQKMDSMERWAPLVQALPLSEAEDIYSTKYASAVMFDLLPAGADVAVLDYAVNSGIARVQRVVPALVGAKSYTAAVGAIKDAGKFVDDICAERLRFMHAIRGGSAWAEFGRGWQARVDDLRVYGEHLVAGGTHETASPAPDLTKLSVPKATHVPATVPGKTAGGAVVAAGAAHVAGVPWWGAALVAGSVVAAGIGYELYEEHKANAANQVVHA